MWLQPIKNRMINLQKLKANSRNKKNDPDLKLFVILLTHYSPMSHFCAP